MFLGVDKSLFKGKWLEKRGFTLLEIMIACVIVGILAAIAIPVFNNYGSIHQTKAAVE